MYKPGNENNTPCMLKAYIFKAKFYGNPLPRQESCLQDRPNAPHPSSSLYGFSVPWFYGLLYVLCRWSYPPFVKIILAVRWFCWFPGYLRLCIVQMVIPPICENYPGCQVVLLVLLIQNIRKYGTSTRCPILHV